MNAIKRERNASMSPSSSGGGYYLSSSPRQQNGKVNGSRHRTNSSPNPQNSTTPNGMHSKKKEKGVVEKLLNSYGFVECSSTGYRVFFHYSEYVGDPNDLLVGDCLEFRLTSDPRNNKLLAVQLTKLPHGSVVVESIADEICIGRVEVEPKIAKNGELSDPSTQGRVSYDKSGEFFFLPFSFNDIEAGETVRKGDTVQFSIATNKRSGSLKARKIKYADPSKQIKPTYGIISSLKESFGFIERADVVAEIFFHYTEYNGKISDLMIGDDVQFQLQNRQGKEIAICINKLEAGTVVFEDISVDRFKGHVIKAINNRVQLNTSGSTDGHLTGMIEYQGINDTHEVLFGDRDTEDDIILQKGDVVEFNVSTDRRDELQRAVHIQLISVCLKDGQKRDLGMVTSLKDGFGFIKCAEQDISIFFHFSEVLEQSHIINNGDEVEFTIETDPISRRQHATRIRFLPKGSVSFETVSSARHIGVIEQEAPERNLKSPSKIKEQEFGVIKSYLNGEETDVLYKLRDCRPRQTPHYRDKVEFVLVTRKSTNQNYARDISVMEVHESEYVKGFICALKEKFGFIESELDSREVFFHYSELDGDPNELELGDEVQYIETRKSEKRSAEKVTKVASNPNNNSCNTSFISKEDILPKVHDGVVTQAYNENEQCEGYIQLISSNVNKTNNDEKAALTTQTSDEAYPFNLLSILDKKDAMPPGTKVTFQVHVNSENGEKQAVNIASKRSEKRGKVESIKGQFGFISYACEDGKSIFFHISEVVDDHGTDLQVGNEVRFVIVRGHKNAKKSAIRVHKIVDERPEHLTRRRSQRFSESIGSSKLCVVRQPSGPDGTTGFKLERNLSEVETVLKEQVSAINFYISDDDDDDDVSVEK